MLVGDLVECFVHDGVVIAAFGSTPSIAPLHIDIPCLVYTLELATKDDADVAP